MRDTNLLHAAQNTVNADAFSTNALQVNKTPARGIWLQFVVSRDGADADETLSIIIYGKDTDASWNAATDQKIGAIGPIVVDDFDGANARVMYVLVQTKLKYIKAYYDVGGTTPDYDVESWGVVPAPARETAS